MQDTHSGLLQANLTRVFNERDAKRRLQALAELYTEDAVMYEPENIMAGQAAISATVDGLLASMPPGFEFTPAGPAVGHHDLLCLRWTGGAPDGPVIVSGTDVAHLKDGRIVALYVLIDSPVE